MRRLAEPRRAWKRRRKKVVTTEDLVSRICALSGHPFHESDRRSLLHAYVACLNFPDLCTTIVNLIDAPSDIRLALRGRLLRLLKDDADTGQLECLVEQTAASEAVDALHSAIFRHLAPPLQHEVLERWVDRGNRRAMARWLKATKECPETYDPDVALRYWRATKDTRAAQSLAYLAGPEVLREVIPELARECKEGWIISRAVIRVGNTDDESWESISTHHPATYLYLCAQLSRPVEPNEAYALFRRCGVDGDRGLAIWAVGQMRMVSVLDRIGAALPDIQEQDLAAYRARAPAVWTD